MPLRILHVVTYMGRGGLETMLMNYYRHIDREKIQFDFLVHREFEADYDQEILALGGRIYRLQNLNPFNRRYIQELDDFFANHAEYKIVHSHLDCMAGIPLKYAKKYGVPVRIAHAHSSNQTKDKKYILKILFKRNITLFATNLFACGKDAGKWMFGTEDFHVLNNAIDTNMYRYNKTVATEVKKGFGIDKDTLVVGHVGLFRKPKNHEFLIKIFCDLLIHNDKAKLLLIGDGEEKAVIEAMIDEMNIKDRVIFAGLRSDVERMLQAMDVFVFPSLYEGLPLSMVEAQAAGLPCIISDKVPIECKKTAQVKQVSLEENTDIWVSSILDAAKAPRKDTTEDIVNAGFDIVANAHWLEQYYLEQYQQA